MPNHLTLSDGEIRAVMDYIWQHARSSPNGKAYRVWKKMFEYLEREIVEVEADDPMGYQGAFWG